MSIATEQPTNARSSLTETMPLGTDTSCEARQLDTLFYDGQCPLCASEIAQLRKARKESLRIVDIHQLADSDGTPSACTQASIQEPNKDQLLRVLHLRRADGSWLKSADANVAAWEGTAHGRALRILRWPLIRHVADLIYAVWARWRYRRLYGKQFTENLHAPD